MFFTAHAKKRSAQRGITPEICDLLLTHGDYLYRKGGSKFRYFSNKSKQRLAEDFGKSFVAKHHEALKAFCIEDLESGYIVTMGKHFKKQPRKKRAPRAA